MRWCGRSANSKNEKRFRKEFSIAKFSVQSCCFRGGDVFPVVSRGHHHPPHNIAVGLNQRPAVILMVRPSTTNWCIIVMKLLWIDALGIWFSCLGLDRSGRDSSHYLLMYYIAWRLLTSWPLLPSRSLLRRWSKLVAVIFPIDDSWIRCSFIIVYQRHGRFDQFSQID